MGGWFWDWLTWRGGVDIFSCKSKGPPVHGFVHCGVDKFRKLMVCARIGLLPIELLLHIESCKKTLGIFKTDNLSSLYSRLAWWRNVGPMENIVVRVERAQANEQEWQVGQVFWCIAKALVLLKKLLIDFTHHIQFEGGSSAELFDLRSSMRSVGCSCVKLAKVFDITEVALLLGQPERVGKVTI